ncbi:MAG: 3-dehydroquinate synthase [Puniceicoccales bacterium]
MESLTVNLGDRSYPIRIGFELFESLLEATHLNQYRRSGRKCALAIDSGVLEQHRVMLDEAFEGVPQWVMPAGETSKSLATAEHFLQFLATNGMDRSSFIIAVGGGVLGDLAGFCAAIYLRGIEFFQIPTTLLSMVDSSVGGKTGVNLPAGKNLTGAFQQPLGVSAWLPFLRTLPTREFSAGMAEVIKYGLLADEDLFHLLEKSGTITADSPVLENLIARCCEIKAEIVAADEREEAAEGGRALLNLGHTFGHAIEAVAGYGEYLHGEAVAIGMLMAVRYSEGSGFLKRGATSRLEKLLAVNGLPTKLHTPLDTESLLRAMGRDKKVRMGKLRLIILDKIGSSRVIEVADSAQLRELWKEFGSES